MNKKNVLLKLALLNQSKAQSKRQLIKTIQYKSLSPIHVLFFPRSPGVTCTGACLLIPSLHLVDQVLRGTCRQKTLWT